MYQATQSQQAAATSLLSALLARDRVTTSATASSKKRMLEDLAALLCRNQPSLDRHTVFQVLNERERLGSTGIGYGIALPHGRLHGITEPIAAALQLRQGLDFDAIDDKPVTLVIGLLVPAEATEQQLKILSALATTFSNASVRQEILGTSDADALYHLLTG